MKKHGHVLHLVDEKPKKTHRKPRPGNSANPSQSDVFGFDQWFKKEVERAQKQYASSGKGKAAANAYIQNLEEWADDARTHIEESEGRYEDQSGS